MRSNGGINASTCARERPRRRHLLGCTLIAVLVTIASTALSTDHRSPEASPERVERGIGVYKTNYCGACHTLTMAGTQGAFGPTHDGMAATAVDRLADPMYSGSATTPEEYVLESILEPMVYLVPGFIMTPHAMPSFVHLPAEDLDALIALLMKQEP